VPSIKRTAAAVFAAAAIAGFGASPASAVGVQSAPMAAPALAPTCGGCGHHHHHHHHHHYQCWESWRCDPYGGIDPYAWGGDCGCDYGFDPYGGYGYDAGWWGGGFGGHHRWGW